MKTIKQDIRELVDKYATAKTKKAEKQLDQLVDALVDLVDGISPVQMINKSSSVGADDVHEFGDVVVRTGPDGKATRVDFHGNDVWSITELDIVENTEVTSSEEGRAR